MIYSLLCLDSVQLENPKVIEPKGLVQNGQVHYNSENWTCRVTSLASGELLSHMQALGVTEQFMKRFKLDEYFNRYLAFYIEWENKGQAFLTFNSDQVMLTAKRGLAGLMIDPGTFWPANLPKSTEQELLASAFARGMIQLEPGDSHRQLVVFRPTLGEFPKQVHLKINHVYYGIENLNFECRFRTRYQK